MSSSDFTRRRRKSSEKRSRGIAAATEGWQRNSAILVSEVIRQIVPAPKRWPVYLHGTRRFVLQRFPFSVVYLDDSDIVNIVAVAHSKRKPGY